MLAGIRSVWLSSEAGCVRNRLAVGRPRVRAGQSRWLPIVFCLTLPCVSRRFCQAIPTPHGRASAPRRWCSGCKPPRCCLTARRGRRVGWGPCRAKGVRRICGSSRWRVRRRVSMEGGGLQGWQRPEEPVAQQRKRTPIEAQERYRWLAGYRGACASQPACPAPLVVPMAAREGARQAWLVDTRRREPPPRAAGRSRAQGHRRRAPGAAQRYGWAERQPTPALGPLPLARARQPDRPPRQGTRAVTAPPVTWHGARRREANCRPARAAPSRPRSPAPPRRSPRCVVTPDQPAGEGLCQCVHGGALVALSVGNRMLFPGAEARVSE